MNDINVFYKNKGVICYNKLCNKCSRSCKQSFRAQIVSCPETKQNKIKKR